MFRVSFFIPSFAENHTAMKALHLLLLAAAALDAAGCISGEQWLSTGRSRGDCHSRRPPVEAGEAPAGRDTSVFLSAVRFGEGYDWRQDSDYGLAEFEVLMYKDFQPYLSIPSSSGLVSPDPDTHHIIGSHLYTERLAGDKTRLAKDGKLLLGFDGQELFRGILPDGEDTYTLSERRDGSGFSLRCNGEVMFSRERGSVFGDLADPSYRPYGALYKDEGKICFCYRDGGGKDETFYYVKDCKAIDSGREGQYDIQDLKVIGGYPVSAESSCLWFTVEEGRLWREADGRVTLAGWMTYGGMDNLSCTVTEDDPETLREICVGDALILHGSRTGYAILETRDKGVEIWRSDDEGSLWQRYEGHRLMSASCADLLGDGHLYAILTPESGDSHIAFCDGESRTVELHGYFSGIRARSGLNPPK